MVGDVPLNIHFTLSEAPFGVAAVLLSAFMKFDEYSICIAITTVEYEISDTIH